MILVSLVAMAVAMLPLAGGFGHADGVPHMSSTGDPVNCCPDSQPCEKTMPDCGSLAGCLMKCSGLSGAVVAPFAIALTVSTTERPSFAVQRLLAPAENPPLPPPRV
jgi:hypothetical protein